MGKVLFSQRIKSFFFFGGGGWLLEKKKKRESQKGITLKSDIITLLWRIFQVIRMYNDQATEEISIPLHKIYMKPFKPRLAI